MDITTIRRGVRMVLRSVFNASVNQEDIDIIILCWVDLQQCAYLSTTIPLIKTKYPDGSYDLHLSTLSRLDLDINEYMDSLLSGILRIDLVDHELRSVIFELGQIFQRVNFNAYIHPDSIFRVTIRGDQLIFSRPTNIYKLHYEYHNQ